MNAVIDAVAIVSSCQRIVQSTEFPCSGKWNFHYLNTVEMHASANIAFGLVMTLTFDAMTLKTFSAMPTHVMNICGKFNSNPSTK